MVTDAASVSHNLAARSFICRTISCAASYAAQPVANVVRLPPVTAVKLYSSTGIGDDSAIAV